MPAARDPFFDFVEELFEPLGPVRIRKMFGGAGVFAHDAMFALLADEVVYLKTDEALRAEMEAEGCEPFVYEKSDGKLFDMGYLSLPTDAAEEPEAASKWGRKALDVALKAKAAKPKRKKRTPAKKA